MDSAAHLFGVATQKPRPLRPGEDAAVETGQGDPFGPASRPAEGLERLFASLEMSEQLSTMCGYRRNYMIYSYLRML